MSFRNLIVVFAITSICGCVSTLSEKQYQDFSRVTAYTAKCFEAEYLSPQLYAELKYAFGNAISGWSYDQERLSIMTREAYSNFSATTQSCRQIEAAAHLMAAQRTSEKQNQEAIDVSNKTQVIKYTVDCKKFGSLSNEIKTFSGTICPVGWYKQ